MPIDPSLGRDTPVVPASGCAICPMEIRGLYATAHNLALRLKSYAGSDAVSACTVTSKFFDLRQSLKSVPEKSDWPVELLKLYQVCQRVVTCKTISELIAINPELERAVLTLSPLVTEHFRTHK